VQSGERFLWCSRDGGLLLGITFVHGTVMVDLIPSAVAVKVYNRDFCACSSLARFLRLRSGSEVDKSRFDRRQRSVRLALERVRKTVTARRRVTVKLNAVDALH